MKKQQIKSQRTRQNIMSAAAELFVRDGYEKTSVNGIVEKAGCSVGAFYGPWQSWNAGS